MLRGWCFPRRTGDSAGRLVLEATTLRFEVGGASATSEDRRPSLAQRPDTVIAQSVIDQTRAVGNDILEGDGLLFAWNTGQGGRVRSDQDK